ncbi:SUR7/PalI family-domain-containing protein [Phycomyces nitens]|nr:SUR7/PalI family-domain-containing protein [Phycomyces nitens]
MICFAISTFFASVFTLFAFLLELFVLIGQLSNKPLLRHLYFGQAINASQGKTLNFNLWNYCTGDINGHVSGCAKPRPAFNWAQTPGISQVMSRQANSGSIKSIFLALFVIIFISCGLSLIFWLMSLPICCLRRRGLGYSMTTLTLINFLLALVAMIIGLVVTIHGGKMLTAADPGWLGTPGNSLWCLIGAVVSLFFAVLLYSAGSCCCKGSKEGRRVRPGKADSFTSENRQRFDSGPPPPPHVNNNGYHPHQGPSPNTYANQGPIMTSPQQHSPMPPTSPYVAPQEQRPYETPTFQHTQLGQSPNIHSDHIQHNQHHEVKQFKHMPFPGQNNNVQHV